MLKKTEIKKDKKNIKEKIYRKLSQGEILNWTDRFIERYRPALESLSKK